MDVVSSAHMPGLTRTLATGNKQDYVENGILSSTVHGAKFPSEL